MSIDTNLEGPCPWCGSEEHETLGGFAQIMERCICGVCVPVIDWRRRRLEMATAPLMQSPEKRQDHSFHEMQMLHSVWQVKNFGHEKSPLLMFLGIVEEAGELAHSLLKRAQGIRKGEGHDAKIKDAVGDIVMYLCAFCTHEGLSLEECVQIAWDEIAKRDWVANPDSAHQHATDAFDEGPDPVALERYRRSIRYVAEAMESHYEGKAGDGGPDYERDEAIRYVVDLMKKEAGVDG